MIAPRVRVDSRTLKVARWLDRYVCFWVFVPMVPVMVWAIDFTRLPPRKIAGILLIVALLSGWLWVLAVSVVEREKMRWKRIAWGPEYPYVTMVSSELPLPGSEPPRD